MEINKSSIQQPSGEPPAMKSQEKSTPEPNNKALSPLHEFDVFSKTVVSSVKEMAEIADKRLSSFLVALGTVLLFFLIFLRVRFFGVQTSDLSQAEFISLVVVCALFLFCGAYLRFYQYQKEREISLSLSDTGARILEKSAESSARILEKTTEAATKMSTGTAPDPNRNI